MRYKFKLIQQIETLQYKYGINPLYPKTKYKDLQKLINRVYKLTQFLDDQHVTFRRISTRMFFLKNNLKNIPLCRQCITLPVNTFKATFCSGECAKKHFDLNETEENKIKRISKAVRSRNYESMVKKQWETRHRDLEKHKLFKERARKSALKILENGLTNAQNRGISVSKTKNKLQENGLTNAQNAGINISISRKLNYTPEKNHWNLIDDLEKARRLEKQYIAMKKTNEESGRWRSIVDLDGYEIYFKAASFKHGFKTNNEEEIKLLEEHGVYSSKSNTKGCVRDHLLSRRYGFENNISTWIISHPANCEIVLHSENVRRSSTNDNLITLEELLERIENWK